MIYTFKLNGEPLLATIGAMVEEKLEEALDESALHIPITVLDYEYKMYGLLEVIADDEVNTPLTFTYLIMSDTVKTVSKEGYFSHDLTAIEYTNKLDKFFINALTFTKPFIRKSRAPFVFDIEETDVYIKIVTPDIFVNEFYFQNKPFTILQTTTAPSRYFSDTLGWVYEYKDIYITFDDTNYYNLTQASRTHTYTTKGVKTIKIGFYDEDEIFVPTFTYYVQVVRENSYTLYDYINVVRDVVPLETTYYHSSTRMFDFDANFETFAKSVEMPQMFFQKMTVRQVLNTMFKYVNAISRLRYQEGTLDILDADYFNKITGSFNRNEITNYESSQDIQGYGSKGLSWLENSLQSNFRDNPSIKTPAEDRFKTVRAKDVQLVYSGGGFVIPLERPIYELSKFEIKLEEMTVSSALYDKVYSNFVLDLTPRMIEKRLWDLKTVTNDFPSYTPVPSFSPNIGMRLNKGGNLYWQRNSTEIDVSPLIGTTIKSTLLLEVLKEALNEYVTLQPYDFNFDTDGNFSIRIATYLDDIVGDDKKFRNISFNIEYITIENPTLQVERADVSNMNYNSSVRINQQVRFTDFGRASRDGYGQLQRSGVPNITFSQIHTNTSEIFDVGTIDSQGYIITERALVFYNDFIEVIYMATLNHNRLNEFNGISQEYRVFETPQFNEIYNRRDFYNDYLVFTNRSATRPFTNNTVKTLLKPEAIPIMFRRFLQSSSDLLKYKLTYAFVRTDGFLELYPDETSPDKKYAIMTPVVSYGGKNALVFTFGFQDNQLAGDALYKKGSGFYNEPIKYTDALGFFDEIWFGLGYRYTPTDTFTDISEANETYFNEEHKYPLVSSGSTELGQTFLASTGTIEEPYPMVVRKDTSSNYFMSYQVSFTVENYDEYVIGQYFSEDNRLVKNQDIVNNINVSSPLFLYKYRNGTKYGIFDDLKVKSGYETPIEITQANATFADGVFTFGTGLALVTGDTSWAIGDIDENLYIACNYGHQADGKYNGFKVLLRHFRPDMLEIGNKSFESYFEAGTSFEAMLGISLSGYMLEIISRTAELNSVATLQPIGYMYQITLGSATISSQVLIEVDGNEKQILTGSIQFDMETTLEPEGYPLEIVLETVEFEATSSIELYGYIYEVVPYEQTLYAVSDIFADGRIVEVITNSASIDGGSPDISVSGSIKIGSDWEVSTNTDYVITVQDTDATGLIYNSGINGCATEGYLEGLLPSASNYVVGVIARVRVNFLNPETFEGETCPTYEYFITV